jgi:hypothetical protein
VYLYQFRSLHTSCTSFVLCSFRHTRRSSLVGGLGAGLRSNVRGLADVAFCEISLGWIERSVDCITTSLSSGDMV